MTKADNKSQQELVLVIDDDPRVRDTIADILSDDYRTLAAASGPEAIETVSKEPGVAVAVMDIRMAGMDGIEAAREVRKQSPDTLIIFHTAFPGDYDEDEIDATERPFDYVVKGEAISRLTRSVRNAVEAWRYQRDRALIVKHAETRFDMIGQSAAMGEVFASIRRVAPTEAKVMILGETGTGKEMVARAIHKNSSRADRPLAILNCNHKSPDLIESELFGHIKGAFTGAVNDRQGLFEYGNGGTVFLDEIGDLDITTQAKLLRVVETGEYCPIGETEMRRVDVRVICATHQDLAGLVEKGSFREDLFYRLRGVKIVLPPLRERREDIPLLAKRCGEQLTIEKSLPPKVFEPEAMDVLVDFDWPGNVRFLFETIEALIAVTDSGIITADDVARQLEINEGNDHPRHTGLREQVSEFERRLILKTLHRTGGNIRQAARLLECDPSNLRKKLETHGIAINRAAD
ncbi:response regulator [candidate division GN15 bacterium]|nr:response regulator [candidate division GN15 bacterium]